MRIAILTDSFIPHYSGVTTYCIELTKQLIKKGHKVMIMAPKHPGNEPDIPDLKGVRLVWMRSVPTTYKGFRASLPSTAKVIQELRKFKVDIIETENPMFLGISGIISSKILGIPCVSVFHTLATSKEYLKLIFKTDNFLVEKANWTYHEKFYNASDKVVVQTKEMFQILIDHNIDKDKIELVSPMFDFYKTKVLKSSDRKVLKNYYQLKEKVAVYLGRLSEEKNLITLLKIWKRVVTKHPSSTLLIIGGGEYRKKMEKKISDEKIEDNVKFLGPIDHKELMQSGLLSICDVFVSASKSETFGLTGVEAMAHKLPVVLFKTQGLSEVVDGGGILCKPDGVAEFSKAILDLFLDKNKREIMGERARKIASKYDSKLLVKKYIANYKETIANYKPSRGSIKYLSSLLKNNLKIDSYKKLFKSL